MELQNSARFIDPASEPQISFGRGGVTRWVIVLCGVRIYVRCEGNHLNISRFAEHARAGNYT
jgi:hypothetical protein